MSAAATIQKQSNFEGITNDQWLEYLYFTVVFSGTYATGGDVLNLQGLSDLLKSSQVPLNVTISGQAGFVYSYVPGASQALGKVKILTGAAAQSALTELSAGAVPAGVTGDTIVGVASFTRQ